MERGKLHPALQNQEFTLDSVIFPPCKIPCLELADIDLMSRLTERITLKTPLISSPMDTVTGSDMAILMASQGGIGAIHFNYPTIEDQMREVEKVRRFEAGFIRNPQVLGVHDKVGDVYERAKENGFFTYPITEDGTLATPMVGIVKNSDVRYRENMDQPISQVMTLREQMVVAHAKDTLDKNDIRAANAIIRQRNLETLPIVDDEFKIVALVTDRDLQKDIQYPLATKDKNKQLKVLVAVESRLNLARERIIAARDTGASGIIIDARNVFADHLNIARFARKEAPDLDVIVGNVVMPEVAQMILEEVGECIDALRVGIGTGEVCITTEELGIGRPLGSSLYDIDKVVRRYTEQTGRYIGMIADGGIKYSRHIVAALMLGAHAVMMGSELAGLDASPVKDVWDANRRMRVKKARGMGSAAVINERAGSNRYMLTGTQVNERVAEGIEKTVPYKGPGDQYISLLFSGVRQSLHGLGHRNLEEAYKDGYLIPAVKAESKGSL